MKPKDEDPKWLVTGVSRLTGECEELTGAMPRTLANERLERYRQSTRRQRYPTYTRLRVELRQPVQLMFHFNE